MGKVLSVLCFCGVYLYVGLVNLGGVSGYLWLLGRRLYFKTSWRPRDTLFLGNLSDLLGVVVRVRRLLPRPVDVRRVAAVLGRALAAALYVARRCRDSPRWKVRTWEVEAFVSDAVSSLAWAWPAVSRAVRRELERLGEWAPV